MSGSLPAFLALVLTVASLFSLSGYQVTGETASTRILGRVGAALIELDRWLPAHRDDLRLLARNRPEAPVVPNDLPIQVEVPSQLALQASDEALQGAITNMMGARLRNQGSSAIRGADGESNLGVSEPVRWTVALLGSSMHGLWQAALALSVLTLLVMCAGLLIRRELPFMPILVGGLIATGLSVIAWVGALALASALDSAVDKEIALALRDGAWIGVRNGLAVSLIALALLYLSNAFLGPRRTSQAPSDDGYAYEGRRASRIETPPY